MAQLSHLIHTYGILIVFGAVLIEQIGLPIPAFPVLIMAGALAVDGAVSWPLTLAASVLACLISDYFWFRAGRHYGKRILRLLCKISLSPDSCVNQTEDNFHRWGAKSLVVAKFVPGFNTVAPPLAGATGVSAERFLWLSVAGGLLWSAVGMGLGAWLHDSVNDVIGRFETLGSTVLMVLGVLLAMFVLLKYIQRRRNRGAADLPRMTAPEVWALLDGGHDPLIVDARGVTARRMEAGIPGALVYGDWVPERLMAGFDRDRYIVVYCTCPNDVTAAQVAQTFVANGFHRARPLHGGLDAWNAHAAASRAEAWLKPQAG